MKRLIMVSSIAGLLCLLLFSPQGCSKKLSYPRQVSLKEANEIVNANLPVPTYLLENFSLTAIYEVEDGPYGPTFMITFYPKGSEDGRVADIDANIEKAPVGMRAKLFRSTKVIGGLKLIGEEYDIAGTRGVFLTRAESNELWWILTYRESGQYEMTLWANKDIPKEELLNMARSVPH